MADYSITISDSVTSTEHIDVLANGTRKITVSDNIITNENIDVLRAGARNITVADPIATTENMDIIRANARNINVSDMSFTTENVFFSILQSPSLINRTFVFTLIIPTALPFIVTKKDV